MTISEEGSSTTSRDRQQLSFTVQTIDCIACSPVFGRQLRKVDGVLEVKELPITNKIIVVFDGKRLEKRNLEEAIRMIAEKSGYGGMILFPLH